MTKLMAKVVSTKIKRVLTATASIALIIAMVLTLMPILNGNQVYGETNAVTSDSENGAAASEEQSLWAIIIGDLEISYVDSQESAEAVVEGLKNYYISKGAEVVSATFDKEVSIKLISANELKARQYLADSTGTMLAGVEPVTESVDSAVERIMAGSEQFHIYYAEEGDTAKSIANKFDNDLDWFVNLNSNLGVDMDNLKGDEILVYKTIEPYISVTTVEKQTTKKTIEYDVTYKYTSKMDADESKVVTKGKDGSKQIVKEITKLNGQTTNSETVSSVVLTKAVDKVVLRGTKNVDAKFGKTYKFADGDDVAKFAKRFVGNPYRYGGSSLTKGADCSGFVMAVYDHFGLELGHSATTQRSYGRAVGYKYAKPGDIIIYPGHAAIYIGGGKIVHAMNEWKGICISSARYDTILSIRRVFED